MAHGQKRKVVVMFGVLRGELLPVHCEAGPSFFFASDDGLSRPRPRSKPHGQCPIPMPRSPRVWGPGPGTRGARGGARSALDSPSRHRDETRTQTDLNRSEQIWVDQEVGSLSKLPGERFEGIVLEKRPTASRIVQWMRSCPVACCWIEDVVAAPSRPGFEACWCRGLRKRAESRESSTVRRQVPNPVGHLALMPRSMTDLASGGEVVDDVVFRGCLGAWSSESGAWKRTPE